MMPPGLKKVVSIFAQLIVIAFFALLGWVGAAIMPILETDTLASLPHIPMSWVQSVIPISAVLILVSEITTLVELVMSPRLKVKS